MNDTRRDIPWLPAHHIINRENYPLEALDQYDGQYVAWNWDGDKILASASTEAEVWEKVKSMGQDPERVVIEFIEIVG
jgi:Family of unknown function (DUF5678)